MVNYASTITIYSIQNASPTGRKAYLRVLSSSGTFWIRRHIKRDIVDPFTHHLSVKGLG